MKRIYRFLLLLLMMISFGGCVDDSTTTLQQTTNIETTEPKTIETGILLNEYFDEVIDNYFNDKDSFLEIIEEGSSLETIALNAYDTLVPEDVRTSQISANDIRINGSGEYIVIYANDYVEYEFTTYIKEVSDEYMISNLSFDYQVVSSLTSEQIISEIDSDIELDLVEINKLDDTEEICSLYFDGGVAYDCSTLDFMKNGGIIYELGRIVELENGLFKVSLNQILNNILVDIDYLYAYVSYSSAGVSYDFVQENYSDISFDQSFFLSIDNQSYSIEVEENQGNSSFVFHDLEGLITLNEYKRKSHSSEIIYNDDELKTITYHLQTTYKQVSFDFFFTYDEFNKEYYLTILNEEIIDILEPSKYDVIQDYMDAVREKTEEEIIDLVVGDILPYGVKYGEYNFRNNILFGNLYVIGEQEYLYFHTDFGNLTYTVDFLEEENNLILMDLDFVNMNTSHDYIYSIYTHLDQLSEEFSSDSILACETYFDEYSQEYCQDYFTKEGATDFLFEMNIVDYQYYSAIAVHFLNADGESIGRELLSFYSYIDVFNEAHIRIINTPMQKGLMTDYLNQMFDDIEDTSVLVQDLLDTSSNQAYLEEFITIITDVRRNGYNVEIDNLFLDYKDNFLVMNLYDSINQELEKSYFIQFDFIYDETDTMTYKMIIKNIDVIDITSSVSVTEKEAYFNMLLNELNTPNVFENQRFYLQYGYDINVNYVTSIFGEYDEFTIYASAQIDFLDATMYHMDEFSSAIAFAHGYYYKTEEGVVFKPVCMASIYKELISQILNIDSTNE